MRQGKPNSANVTNNSLVHASESRLFDKRTLFRALEFTLSILDQNSLWSFCLGSGQTDSVHVKISCALGETDQLVHSVDSRSPKLQRLINRLHITYFPLTKFVDNDRKPVTNSKVSGVNGRPPSTAQKILLHVADSDISVAGPINSNNLYITFATQQKC